MRAAPGADEVDGTVTPLNAAAAVFLAAEAEGRVPLVPITNAPHPELARLLLLQIQRGGIPDEEYERARRVLGCSERTLQRHLAALRRQRADAPAAGRPRAFELTEHHRRVIFACHGNVALAYKSLRDQGEALPEYSTFWRRWHAQPTGVQRYARKGAEGLVDF